MPASTGVFAGQRITASLLARAVPTFAYKATATSLTTQTALQADPDLVFALNAPFTYHVELLLQNCAGASNPGIQYAFTVPTGSSGTYTAYQNNIGGSFQEITSSSWTATNTATLSTSQAILIKGVLITTVAGSLTFTWAQNTSNATATTVGAYSYLQARQAM